MPQKEMSSNEIYFRVTVTVTGEKYKNIFNSGTNLFKNLATAHTERQQKYIVRWKDEALIAH